MRRLKQFARWAILGGTLFFLARAVKGHWREVAALRLDGGGWAFLLLALAVTLLAHLWSGWVWGWILRSLAQPVSGSWSTLVYLKTNIAKYLPGNVWHFYGRVMAAKAVKIPVPVAVMSVVMEALLMAIAALVVALAGNLAENRYGVLQGLGLLVGLAAVHPRLLNPLMQRLARAKGKALKGAVFRDGAASNRQVTNVPQPARLTRYPLRPLLGELGFLLLRGAGFLVAVRALTPVALDDVPSLLSGFSLAWLLGLVVPGAPGGIGVFEATALALLEPVLPAAVLLGAIALYRLVSTLAEAIGAALAILVARLDPRTKQ
ncbi:MAG: lysylphosphatidylglycerol synthase domain-containing protein [Elainellaceae cyanobacterium]